MMPEQLGHLSSPVKSPCWAHEGLLGPELPIDFGCFVVLRPKSTAMVMAGRSVHLTTLFTWASLNKAVNQYFVHILLLVTDNNPS